VGIPLALVGRQAGRGRYVVTSSAVMIVNEGGWGGR
jgi:hypothetical protein